jgi:hypothetical protein
MIRPNQIGFMMGRSILDKNFLAQESLGKDPQQGRGAAAPSNIREIQGGQEAPHNGGTINPKDA